MFAFDGRIGGDDIILNYNAGLLTPSNRGLTELIALYEYNSLSSADSVTKSSAMLSVKPSLPLEPEN